MYSPRFCRAFKSTEVRTKDAIAIGPVNLGGGAVQRIWHVGEGRRVWVCWVGVAVHSKGVGGGPVTAYTQQGGVHGRDHRVWVDEGQISNIKGTAWRERERKIENTVGIFTENA